MKINTFLRYTILGGLLLALFATPFIVSTSLFFPYIAGKGFFFRLVVEICFALWIVLLARDGRYWPKKSQLLYAVLAFITILTLSTIFSVNPYRSFWSNFERMEGLVSYLHLFAYFIMLVSLMGAVDGETRKKEWHFVLYTTVIASVCMALYGLISISDTSLISSQSGLRVDGRFGNAAYMAVYMLLHIFLILYLSLKRHMNHWLTWFMGGAAVLEFIILAYTQTRGAFYGTIIGIILALVVIAYHKGGVWRKGTFGVILLAGFIFGGLYSIRDREYIRSNPVLNRLLSVSLSQHTVASRTTIWGMAVEGIGERPILGYGLENFNLVFNKYYKSSLYQQEQWFDRAHNVFFDWLSAAGILGLLAYLSLFALALVVIWKRKSGTVEERAALTGLLAAYFIHNFFVFDNLLSSVLFFTLLAYLAGFDAEHHSNSRSLTSDSQMSDFKNTKKGPDVSLQNSTDHGPTLRYAVGTVAFFIMFPLVYIVTIKPYLAGAKLITAISPCAKDRTTPRSDGQIVCNETREDAAKRQLAEFNRVFELGTFATTEAREQLVTVALQTGGNPQVSQPVREEFLKLAEREMQSQLAVTPDDARYRLFMGMFYRVAGHLELAIPQIEEAVRLTPNKPSMLGNLATMYAENNELPKALEIAKKSYELEKRNDEAGRILFAVYLKMGKRAEAISLLEEMIKNIDGFEQTGRKYIEDVKAGKNP